MNCCCDGESIINTDEKEIAGMRVQVVLKAKNLTNKAGVFQTVSDPYAVIYKDEDFDPSNPDEGMLARTERIKDNLSPKWATPLIFDFYPEESETVVVCIYDHNSQATDVQMTQGIQINLLQAIQESTEQGKEASFPLIDADSTSIAYSADTTLGSSTLSIYAFESQSKEEMIHLQLRARKVKNIEQGIFGFGKTDPYLEISKKHFYPELGITHWLLVHRTEEIHDHLNPVWEGFTMSTELLCDGDWDKSLRITLIDYEKRSDHRTLGHIDTTLSQLKECVVDKGNGDLSNALTILRDGKKSGSKKGVGKLLVLKLEEF